MNVSSVTTTTIPATSEKPVDTRYTLKPTHKARAEAMSASTPNLAKKCRIAMGKILWMR
ncbi:hypothetical protein [Burkholderia sp. Ed8]|uniref:hypothetical protein n=1 Tax=Burkholderia sp. Ed8 TaxID=3112957 RepID=UPI00345CDAFE